MSFLAFPSLRPLCVRKKFPPFLLFSVLVPPPCLTHSLNSQPTASPLLLFAYRADFLISWSAVTPPHNKPVFVLISDPAVTVSSRLDSHPSRSLIPSCLTTPPKIMTLSFFLCFCTTVLIKKKSVFLVHYNLGLCLCFSFLAGWRKTASEYIYTVYVYFFRKALNGR